MTTTGRQPALTPEEQAALDRARRVSHALDEAITVPGTNYRIGLDPILGIAPVSGDAVAALGSLYIVATGLRLGLPRPEAARMLGLIALEFVVGSVPVLGPIVDAHWKINKRNVDRLESYLAEASSGTGGSGAGGSDDLVRDDLTNDAGTGDRGAGPASSAERR